MLCCFAAELKERVHLWVNEVVSALVPNLSFEFSEEVRMVAISEFVVTVAENRDIGCGMMEIVPKEVTKLLNALLVEMVKFGHSIVNLLQDSLFVCALKGTYSQIPGSRLSKHQAEKFVEGISKLNWYYEDWIPLLLNVCYHEDPDVPQIVAIAIGICAEFGSDFLKPHTEGIFGCLKTALEHPNAKYQDNIMAYEAAVSTCGKLNQFLSVDIYTYEPPVLAKTFATLPLSHQNMLRTVLSTL
ncbi:hypothetical protein R3W88_015835 [Solanum pinnatisectum]|uniref:Uncharacterized protein n=1 Tax=Solanum pinnatisectum TaxID=50273 RepID=A0AAV9KWS6_9SOLN|nr:hypothetical protein R3W88_015835 [Solanum pinnatisectum]